MKKIYLCALALSVGTVSFAQYAKQNTIAFKEKATNTVNTVTKAPQDKGLTLWSDDFSVPGNWTATAVVAPDNWVIGTTAPAGSFAIPAILSTTAANNFALFDSDLMCSGNQNATLTSSAITTLGSSPNVSLVFQQYYRNYQGTTWIGVSNDGGTTWVDTQVNVAVAGNGSTANPETVRVNISATAGNQASVMVRFQYIGGCDYAWMVDDVEIQETDPNDLVASDAYYGSANLPYTRIPVAQIQPIEFAMKASNIGSADQTGTMLTADINGGTFTGVSPAVTVLVGATDSLVTSTQFTPPATTGVAYTPTLTVNSSFTDATQANNAIAFPPFEVSQYIYAMDDYSATPGNGGGFSGTDEEFEAGNFYDVVANATVSSVDVQIGSNAVAGNALDAAIYELDATGAFVLVVRTTLVQLTAAEIGTLKTFSLTTPQLLTAGKTYFAAIHSYAGAGEFFYGTSGQSTAQGAAGGVTSLIYYGTMDNPVASKNFYTTQTPMVRLNFDPLTSVDNIAAKATSFTAYPNPSTGMFNINLTKDMGATVNMTVRNVVGQTVINKQVAVTGNQVETISLANYDKGIYFLTINNETVKLIVE